MIRALRWHGPGDVRLDEVDEPVAGPGEVVVRVLRCGICGTDRHEYESGPNLIPTRPHRLTGSSPPVTLGHEIVGTIEEVGPGGRGVAVGDRVVVEPCLRCGRCRSCQRGDHHRCKSIAGVGLAADGGLADLIAVPDYTLTPVPDDVDDDVAVWVEPLAVGLRAVERGGVGVGRRVAVNGFGPIGATAAMWARAAGADHVTVLEPSRWRREAAACLDVDDVFDPADVPLDALRRHPARPDVVIDCVGLPELLGPALRGVAPGGSVVWTGVSRHACTFAPVLATAGERSVVGALGHGAFDSVVAALAGGRLPVNRLHTATVPLDGVVEAALAGDPGQVLKVIAAP